MVTMGLYPLTGWQTVLAVSRWPNSDYATDMKHRNVMVLLLVLMALELTGCKSFGPMRIKPVSTTTGATLYPGFTRGYYRMSRDLVFHFILFSTTRTATGGSVQQVMILRVFWKPIPGVTPILHTAINTTIRYLIFTPDGCGMYQGAGFVRLHNGRHARVMHASLVDGDLRLTGASGYFTDVLGPARITGDFTALRSKEKNLTLTLHIKRKFFATTLANRRETGFLQTGGTAPAVRRH